MAVTTLNTSVTYTGTNSVGPFSFNFSISSPAALTVIQGGTTLASSAYTIVPINNNYDNGGLVTLTVPCPVGISLVLQRITPLNQGSIFYDNLPLPMNQFESGLDKLTEITQELAAGIAAVSTTGVVAGTGGIIVTGSGKAGDPYVISFSGAGGGSLTITSFTGGTTFEIGHQISSATFGISYTGTPTSGNITNTDGVSSPASVISPFTSGSVYGNFNHTSAATVTFTLTLSNGSASPTMTQTISWAERIFGGTAPVGATSSVTSSGNNAVLTTGTIGTAQLGAENVGQTFGPYSPSGQAIYLLLANAGHTFVDAATGFPFSFNTAVAVSFVNQNGVTVPMWLYQSTNPLSGTFTPKVAS